MKKLMMIAAAAALVAGCGENEAKRFGYRGADLDVDDMMFFSTGPLVTNWVPARVLNVCEKYEMSAAEDALIKAAGVIVPSSTFTDAPAGYSKLSVEPWFTTWTKDSENFGRKGVCGFISHFDEDKKVWLTSETYFSSYYDDKDSALAALADLKKKIADGFAPKRFHEFDNCWIAEYLRLRVMCLVGQKADGKWSCMLDINDKCNPGCGQWEGVQAQAERLANYKYRKQFAQWKAKKDALVAANHEAIEKIRLARGLELLGEDAQSFEAVDGRKVLQRVGMCQAAEVKDRVQFWKQKLDELARCTGVAFADDKSAQDVPSGHVVWGIAASNDIYEVRLDMAFAPALDAAAEAPGEETPSPIVEWRELCIEKTLPRFAIPSRPKPPAR